MISENEILLDSLTILPETIEIRSHSLLSYHHDINTGLFHFNQTTNDSATVCYQTLPYALHTTYQRKSLVEYNEQKLYTSNKKNVEQKVLDKREELFPTENLQKSGSLSRGISFGNTQNVVVNSALNLQLEGKISDDLNIRASITDQNVPFQPEGNTAQIQDFDNVYIELYNHHFSLRGGDVVFQNKSSEFLRYYKNVQGGQVAARYQLGEKSKAETSLGISVAKGKFASIVLEVEEGVSGPYRIRIPDASDFAIIMANSERVFLDGRQLQRGFNLDYIIDYNRAEIQFTSGVLITKFSRVRIDVEYSDQNYSRSIVAASHYQTTGKAGFSFNYYAEKDNPNRPLTVQLTDTDRALMQDIGDNLDEAVKISAQRAEYSPDRILYELIDTVDLDMNPVQVYRYSQNREVQLFTVSFSETGQGRGSYVLKSSTANGRIYEWVSPENEILQGNFAPVIKIPAPTDKQMATIGGSFELSKYERSFAELAFSTNDLNRFSELDSNDDHGFALKAGLESKNRPLNFLKDYRFSARADFEYDNEFFNPIDRFRYIEFDRDWNYDQVMSQDQSRDHILNAGFDITKNALNKMGYKFVKRKRDVYVDGTQHYLDFSRQFGRFQLISDAFLMANNSAEFDATWNRINLTTTYRTRYLVPGYKLTIDENVMKTAGTDSISGTAMNYREHKFFVQSNDTLKTSYGISYSIREDLNPAGGELQRSDASNTVGFYVNSAVSPNQKLNFLLTYRNNMNYQLPGEPKSEETLMTRADWYAGLFKRHVRSELTYAIGNGRELKREYVFLQVPTGEGTHTWRDDNGDGLQDLSEFYLTLNPDEKNYIKIFVPSNEYVFAYENNFNYRLNFEMPRSWKSRDGILKLLSRISGNSSWGNLKRITNPDLAARILPFYRNIPDEDVLSEKETLRGRLFYNRANPGFGFDAGYHRLANKQLLTQGFDERTREEFSANARLNLSNQYALKIMYLTGSSNSSSDFLQGHNYHIQQRKINPELSWQPGTNFRMSAMYGLSNKINITGEPKEETQIHEFSANTRISKATQFAMDAMLKYSNIRFNGDPNTPVGYDMLEALQPGQNYSWMFIIQKKILQGLQLSVNYEGRKSENADAVHIGRMQVSALF